MSKDLTTPDPRDFGLASFADLLSSRPPMPEEEPGGFQTLREGLLASLTPMTPYECVVAESLVAIEWELHQRRRMREHALRKHLTAAVTTAAMRHIEALHDDDVEDALDAAWEAHVEAGGNREDWENPFPFDRNAARERVNALTEGALSSDPQEQADAYTALSELDVPLLDLMGEAYGQATRHDAKAQELERPPVAPPAPTAKIHPPQNTAPPSHPHHQTHPIPAQQLPPTPRGPTYKREPALGTHQTTQGTSMTEDDPNLPWLLAQLRPSGLAMALRNLERQSVTVFAPTQTRTERRGQKFVTREAPAFPGYVFVQPSPATGGIRAINATRGITKLVSLGPEPAVVPPGLVAARRLRFAPRAELPPPHSRPETRSKSSRAPWRTSWRGSRPPPPKTASTCSSTSWAAPLASQSTPETCAASQSDAPTLKSKRKHPEALHAQPVDVKAKTPSHARGCVFHQKFLNSR